jgi:hypothetical protein
MLRRRTGRQKEGRPRGTRPLGRIQSRVFTAAFIVLVLALSLLFALFVIQTERTKDTVRPQIQERLNEAPATTP